MVEIQQRYGKRSEHEIRTEVRGTDSIGTYPSSPTAELVIQDNGIYI